MLVHILGVSSYDDLVLTACLNDLNNAGHLLDFLCHGLVRSFFQDKTQSGGAVCCC